MTMVENERTKLLASTLNNIGVATIITGVVAPAAAALYGHRAISSDATAFLIGYIWLLSGIGLHVLAQATLGRLRP